MQWVAMLTMVLDHIGSVWFPNEIHWREVGRLAFPIYAYLVAKGMSYTSNRKRYLIRLGILAVLSQLPFMLAFQTQVINVIGTIAVTAACIFESERYKQAWIRWGWIIVPAILLEFLGFDYGAYGILLIYMYRRTSGVPLVIAHFLLNCGYLVMKSSLLQFWSLLPTLLIVFYQAERLLNHVPRTPKWLWRSFYPAHLILLVLLNRVAF